MSQWRPTSIDSAKLEVSALSANLELKSSVDLVTTTKRSTPSAMDDAVDAVRRARQDDLRAAL